MKKLIICAILLNIFSLSAFASDAYCPPSISCKNQICTGFSNTFYSQGSATPSFADGIYNFYQAEGNPSPSHCFYQQQAGENTPKVILGSNLDIYPDKSIPGNEWSNNGADSFWCATNNSQLCPFYSQSKG